MDSFLKQCGDASCTISGFFKVEDAEHAMSEMATKNPLLEKILKYEVLACYISITGGVYAEGLLLKMNLKL